jgi:hypothetical protein
MDAIKIDAVSFFVTSALNLHRIVNPGPPQTRSFSVSLIHCFLLHIFYRRVFSNTNINVIVLP